MSAHQTNEAGPRYLLCPGMRKSPPPKMGTDTTSVQANWHHSMGCVRQST
jgi:hypothetical protein